VEVIKIKRKIHIPLSYLALSIIVLWFVVETAFAQAKPSKPRGTIKTKLSRIAVIEEPASAMMIRGRILDPNNEPALGARIVALPNTSYGAQIYLNNKEAYFEIPWSQTWLDKGQPVCLIAIGHYQRNEAAIVEISDPTQPVTVRLESAPRLIGKVTDNNGQQLEKFKATLSLATKFKCHAPIFETTGGPWSESIFKRIPYDTNYKLTIKSDGYQTKQVAVDAMDRSKKVFDIGTIILLSQASAKSPIPEQKTNPDLAKEFHDIYKLDEGEVIKFIKPPFVLGRQEYLLTTQHSSFALQHPGHHYGFRWYNKLIIHSFSTSNRLEWILSYVLGIPEYDYKLTKGLKIYLPGDWIVRTDSTKEEQLKALEEIIYAETNRSVRFEKQKVECEVIVAKGLYKFKPHPNGLYPNHILVTWDGTLANWQRTANSLKQFFGHLERDIKMKIVDETEPMENTPIRYRESKNLAWLAEPERKNKYLSGFLFNLSLTTSLKFTVEKRPAEIWVVTEKK
jgi:hypothetical protein